MTALQRFYNGFFSCFRAFGFVSRKGLVKYYFLMAGLALLLFFFTFWAVWGWTNSLADGLVEWLLQWRWLNGVEAGVAGKVASRIVAFLLKSLAFMLLYKISKYIYLILFSPLFAFLSEKTEQLVKGVSYSVSVPKILKDAVRGVLISVRNLVMELLFVVGGTLLSLLFPPAAVPVSVFLLLVGFYYYGFAMIDYSHERWGLTVRQSITRIRQQKYRAMGIGAFFFLCNLIPVFGWIVAGVNTSVGAVLSDPSLFKDRE